MRLILPIGYTDATTQARRAMRLSALRERGWQVTVYSPGLPALDAPMQDAGIDLRHLPMRGVSDYLSIRHMAKHLEEEARNTILLAQNHRTAFIALCARKLARRQDLRVVLMSSRRTPPHTSWLARRIYRNLQAILFTSVYSMALFRQTEIKTGHALTPLSGQHLYLEGAGEQPPRADEPKGPVIALFNGELRSGCGLGAVIDTLDKLRGGRIRLMIAGNGNSDYMDRLRRRAIRCGVMDLISWRRDRIPVSEIAAQCHFGIFPYKDENGFGDANIEMMAAGRPQIITKGYVANEYLQENGGALFTTPGNPDAYADGMLGLATDNALRLKLGNEAALRYRNLLSPKHTLDNLEALLTHLE